MAEEEVEHSLDTAKDAVRKRVLDKLREMADEEGKLPSGAKRKLIESIDIPLTAVSNAMSDLINEGVLSVEGERAKTRYSFTTTAEGEQIPTSAKPGAREIETEEVIPTEPAVATAALSDDELIERITARKKALELEKHECERLIHESTERIDVLNDLLAEVDEDLAIVTRTKALRQRESA